MTRIDETPGNPFTYPVDMVITQNCGLVSLSIATGKPLAEDHYERD